MTNHTDPNFLYTQTEYVGTSYPRTRQDTDVIVGGLYTFQTLRSGTEVEVNGQRGVVMARYSKNTLVRIHETQQCVMVPNVANATVLAYGGWANAVPQIGTFIEVRNGDHQGKSGIVAEAGLNSAHVIIPGFPQVVKLASKNMIVLDQRARITL